MSFYPVFVQLEGKKVLVVGGGNVACRKVEALMACGAVIHLAGRELVLKLDKMVQNGDIHFKGRQFHESLLEEMFMVIAATDDNALNHEISRAARRKRILVNAVDQPADCDFIVPSILKRGDLIMAISTSGRSPALARKIRKRLENYFGPEYETFLSVMGRLRSEVLSLGFPQKENSQIFQSIVDSDLLEDFKKGISPETVKKLERLVPEGVNLTKVFDI